MAAGVGIRDALGRGVLRGTLRAGVPPAGIVGYLVLFFLPLGAFYYQGLTGAADGGPDGGTLATVVGVLTDGATWRTAGFSAGQALVSATVCVVVGLPGAYAVSHLRFPFKRLLRSISLIPFVLPSIVVIIATITFYGKNGIVNRALGTDATYVYSAAGIILAHVLYNLSLAVRVIGDGWSRISGRYLEAARSLGDRPVRVFFRVVLPLLVPHIAAAFVLIFMYCFFSFGIVLVFGGIRYATFEVRIYQELFVRLDLARAAVYGLVQLGFSVFFLAATGVAARAQTTAKSGVVVRQRRFSSLPQAARVLLAAYALVFATFLIGPFAGLIGRSLTPRNGVSLFAYRALFDPAVSPVDVPGIIRSTVPGVILRSIALAAAAGSTAFCFALVLSMSRTVRERPLLRRFFESPLGVSLVSYCIGVRMLAGGVVPTPLLVVTAQVFVALPFVFRLLCTVMDDLRPALVEAARGLGASPLRTVRDVHWPLLRPGLMNAYAYAVAIAFADFTAVLTVGRGSVATFPVAIYRLIGFRSFDLAIALSVLYLIMCLGLFIWIDYTSRARETRSEASW